MAGTLQQWLQIAKSLIYTKPEEREKGSEKARGFPLSRLISFL